MLATTLARRCRALISLCVLALLMLTLPAGSQAATAREKAMTKQLIDVRAAHSLPSLTTSATLTRKSRAYARLMLRKGRWAHDSSRGRSGEVIAVWNGSGGSTSRIVKMWMDSKTHRSVILKAGYRRVGVAAVSGRFRGKKATLWVARFTR